jgi:hypothetical protein
METLLNIGQALKVVGEVTFAIIMWFVLAAFVMVGMTLLVQIFMSLGMAIAHVYS